MKLTFKSLTLSQAVPLSNVGGPHIQSNEDLNRTKTDPLQARSNFESGHLLD